MRSLARLADAQVLVGVVEGDDPHLGAGDEFADRAGRCGGHVPYGDHVGARGQFRHAVRLAHGRQAQAVRAGGGEVRVEGGGGADDVFEGREVVLGDRRVLGEGQDYRRGHVEAGDAVVLDGREEGLQVEAREDDDRGAQPQGAFMRAVRP
jgi:hypothetical protein